MWLEFSSESEALFLNMDAINIIEIKEHAEGGVEVVACGTHERIYKIRLLKMTKDQMEKCML